MNICQLMPVSVAKPIDVPFSGCLRPSHRSPAFILVCAAIDAHKCAFVYLCISLSVVRMGWGLGMWK